MSDRGSQHDSVRDPVREEAERLVAAALAAVSLAARGLGGGRFATGSDECCVCPVCRVIVAMREPNADVADRLASGAGDLASAVAGLLRTLSRPTSTAAPSPVDRAEAASGRARDEFWESLRQRAHPGPDGDSDAASLHDIDEATDDPWRAATTGTRGRSTAAPKPMAKKAVKKATKKANPAPDQ